MKKQLKNNLILILLFAGSVLIRTILGILYGEYSVFTDELVHTKMAWNLSHTGKLFLQGFPKAKDDFFYYICLLPAFLAKKQDVVRAVIVFINSILASSVIFPINSVVKYLNPKEEKFRWILVVFLVLPEMWYSAGALQENLFLPLFWWGILIYLKYLNCKKEEKFPSVLMQGSIFGAVSCVLCMTKDVGYLFIAVAVAGMLIEIVRKRIGIRTGLTRIVIYIIAILALRSILYGIIRSFLLDETATVSLVPLTRNQTESAMGSFLTNLDLKAYLRLASSYLGCFVLATGGIPFLFALSGFKSYSTEERRLLNFAIIMLFLGVFVVAGLEYNLYTADNFRIHYRYLYYLTPAFWILYETSYNHFTEKNEKKYRWSYLVVAVLFLGNILIVNILPNIQDVNFDCPSMNQWTMMSINYSYFFVRLVIVFLVLSGAVSIYCNKIEVAKTICVILIISGSIYSNQLVYKTLDVIKDAHAVTKSDVLKINQYINDKTDKQALDNTFLLLEGGDASDYYLLECYLDAWYYRSFYQEYVNKAAENPNMDISELNVYLLDRSYYTEEKQIYDYILSIYPIDAEHYQGKDIGLQKYYLYEYCADD